MNSVGKVPFVGRSYQNFVGKSLPITVEGRKVDVSTLYDVNQEVWVVDHEAENGERSMPPVRVHRKTGISPGTRPSPAPSCQGDGQTHRPVRSFSSSRFNSNDVHHWTPEWRVYLLQDA